MSSDCTTHNHNACKGTYTDYEDKWTCHCECHPALTNQEKLFLRRLIAAEEVK